MGKGHKNGVILAQGFAVRNALVVCSGLLFKMQIDVFDIIIHKAFVLAHGENCDLGCFG